MKKSSLKALMTQGNLLAIVLLMLAALVIYVFYEAKLPHAIFSKERPKSVRDFAEDRLYDIRSRLKPDIEDVSKIVIVAIDEPSIAQLNDSLDKPFSYSALARIIQKLELSNAEKIALFLYPSVFDYNDPELESIVDLVKRDKRLSIGILGVDAPYPSPRDLPAGFESIADRVYGLETFRKRSYEIVRRLPYVAYRHGALKPLYPIYLAGESEVGKRTTFDRYMLNYTQPERFKTVSAKDLFLNGSDKVVAELSGKIVLVGYGKFIERTANPDQIYANTPWHSTNTDAVSGVPLHEIVAVALSNLMNDSFLKPAPNWVNICQTIFVAALSGLAWLYGFNMGLVLLLGWWIFLFYLHSMVFSFANTFIPLSDAILFSAFAIFAGGLWHLRRESKIRLSQEFRADSQRQLASVQSRFLDQFAAELSHINEKIIEILRRQDIEKLTSATIKKIYARLENSCEEFRDYLFGIKQFASITTRKNRQVHKNQFALRPMIKKIVGQFDARIEEAHLQIQIDCPESLMISTDEHLLEAIVFNLVSNAIKYSPPEGVVKIVAAEDRSGLFKLTVKDDGPGIDSKFHSAVFEKFYRVQDDQVYKIKGNGLGLYLCNFFAERIGAQIELQSELGKGALFSLTFAADTKGT
jgi:signal transduction histidine kinase